MSPACKDFSAYGGRGILVCERWRDDFVAFLADMGPRPTPQHSIDRRDVNGDYCPENCRWATPVEQARNRRSTVMTDEMRRTAAAMREAGRSWGDIGKALGVNKDTARDTVYRPQRKR
jgi:hypothetical protein